MNHKQKHQLKRLGHLALAGTAVVGLGGCGSSSSGGSDSSFVDRGSDETSETFQTATIDASDASRYRYFNLNTGSTLDLTDAEAATSTEWHVGFSRYNVILNSGDSGIGNVTGALAATQEEFYLAGGDPDSNVFLNATADSEQEHLLATYDLSALSFVSDTKASAIQGSEAMTGTTLDMGWYNYNIVTHTLAVNDQNWWLLRSSAGDSYALFRATSLTNDPVNGVDVTFEFDVQPSGVSQFTGTATFNASIPSGGGEACFDFDNDITLDCRSDDWDLKLEIDGRDWLLWTHSGVTAPGNGGAFGPLETADADLYTSATVSPEGRDIRFLYDIDRSAGVFTDNSWYAYNLQGARKLWPNYRVYLIDTDSSNDGAPVYALQITSYYSDGGASGFPTIRYVQQ